MNILLKDDERIDDLGRGMKIIQSSSTPCFSIDAVLLADFVSAMDSAKIIELGSGTGVIPLLLADKMPQAQIYGIEIIEQMCSQAQRSIELNCCRERIKIFHGDLREADKYFAKSSADIVVANPPYYKKGHGRPNKDYAFAAARSEEFATLSDIIAAAAKLSKPLGTVYLIFTASRLAELFFELISNGLNPEKLRLVQPYAEREANLALIMARKKGNGTLQVLPPLVVYASPGCYTEEMEKIYAR